MRLLFHYISYLQYPLMLVAILFPLQLFIAGIKINSENVDTVLKNLNIMLVFMGLAISFSTLQDPTKTQNKLSKNIWENPRKGKLFIGLMSFLILFFVTSGIVLYFNTESKLNELSFGVIAIGIGQIGLLKTALEMFENHRLDKPNAENLNKK